MKIKIVTAKRADEAEDTAQAFLDSINWKLNSLIDVRFSADNNNYTVTFIYKSKE